jgi:hypothetical protein
MTTEGYAQIMNYTPEADFDCQYAEDENYDRDGSDAEVPPIEIV